jgi:hypothetical protein
MNWEYCWTDSLSRSNRLQPLIAESQFGQIEPHILCVTYGYAKETLPGPRVAVVCPGGVYRPDSLPPKPNAQPGGLEERTRYSSPSVSNCPTEAKIGLKWGSCLPQFWRALHLRSGILFLSKSIVSNSEHPRTLQWRNVELSNKGLAF